MTLCLINFNLPRYIHIDTCFILFRYILNDVFQYISPDEFDIEEDTKLCADVEDYCLDPWIGTNIHLSTLDIEFS